MTNDTQKSSSDIQGAVKSRINIEKITGSKSIRKSDTSSSLSQSEPSQISSYQPLAKKKKWKKCEAI